MTQQLSAPPTAREPWDSCGSVVECVARMIAPGTQIGPYEILDPVGAGGMGEVYGGRDPRLDRDGAIKVLPASLSTPPSAMRVPTSFSSRIFCNKRSLPDMV